VAAAGACPTSRETSRRPPFDPDTAEQDVDVLLRIHRELGGVLALDCDVLQPGRVRVGDPVEIRPGRE